LHYLPEVGWHDLRLAAEKLAPLLSPLVLFGSIYSLVRLLVGLGEGLTDRVV
jgi:hypothetical protein